MRVPAGDERSPACRFGAETEADSIEAERLMTTGRTMATGSNLNGQSGDGGPRWMASIWAMVEPMCDKRCGVVRPRSRAY